jgi:predicted kinase
VAADTSNWRLDSGRVAVGRLIVLNGPAGCGKSTLAQRFADDHPLVLNLDIDRLRGMLGCWRDELDLAGPMARAMALAVARVHLDSGRDVIIPQFLGRPEFLMRLEQLAREAGADFREVVLLDSKENALRRFTQRGTSEDPAAVAAHELVLDPGLAELGAMYDRLMATIATRPLARIVWSVEGQVEQTYTDLLASLD